MTCLNANKWLIGSIVLLDQFSKWLAGKFNLNLINEGFSFSLFPGFAYSLFFSLLILIFQIWLGWRLLKIMPASQAFRIGYALLVAGGVSNLIDRFLIGGVRDWIRYSFLDLKIHGNLADLAIVVGCFLCIYSLRRLVQSA